MVTNGRRRSSAKFAFLCGRRIVPMCGHIEIPSQSLNTRQPADQPRVALWRLTCTVIDVRPWQRTYERAELLVRRPVAYACVLLEVYLRLVGSMKAVLGA